MSVVEYENLSPIQKSIVEIESTDVIVTGGAGTGKTFTALWAARRELERQDSAGREPGARILMLTFSRTATSRVMSRAGALLRRTYGERIEIQTFHGFAFRIITEFGRYFGHGSQPVSLQSATEKKLLGAGIGDFQYDELLPAALRILRSPLVEQLLSTRWTLVICDEFQDTSDIQWELLELLGESARLLLLADLNQMIYEFLPGVGPHRMTVAQARNGIIERELERESRRDVSQQLPAAAEAIRNRDFGSSAISAALASGRLEIRAGVSIDHSVDAVIEEVDALRAAGHKSLAVYVRENAAVAALCTDLGDRGVAHTPVGIPEARSHALTAIVTVMLACLQIRTWDNVCRELALYLTSVTRGRVPTAAQLLLRGQAESPALQQRLDTLRETVAVQDGSMSFSAALEIAAQSWSGLGFTAGSRNWTRAAKTLMPIALRLDEEGLPSTTKLEEELANLRSGTLLTGDDEERGGVQVMNMNQTKGREADATVVLTRDDDFYGYQQEWEGAGSRLLYVALTRARHRVVILISDDPHWLWAPLRQRATRVGPPIP